jgi:hypothetical protein
MTPSIFPFLALMDEYNDPKSVDCSVKVPVADMEENDDRYVGEKVGIVIFNLA